MEKVQEWSAQIQNEVLEIRVKTLEAGFALRLQSLSEEILMEFKVNPNRVLYSLDIKSLNIQGFWVILLLEELEVKRQLFQFY
jgi:hypothetical protein